MLNSIKNAGEEYVKVSEIARQIIAILGIKPIAGRKINNVICNARIQKNSEGGKSRYEPTSQFKYLAKEVPIPKNNISLNSEYDTYFKWKNEIVLLLLGVDADVSLQSNLKVLVETVTALGLAKGYEININVLLKELAKFLGVKLTKEQKEICYKLWTSYILDGKDMFLLRNRENEIYPSHETRVNDELVILPIGDDIWSNI